MKKYHGLFLILLIGAAIWVSVQYGAQCWLLFGPSLILAIMRYFRQSDWKRTFVRIFKLLLLFSLPTAAMLGLLSKVLDRPVLGLFAIPFWLAAIVDGIIKLKKELQSKDSETKGEPK